MLTIKELAALRGWDRKIIAEWAWAGELPHSGESVTRNGVTFIPMALMRFDDDVEGWWGKEHPLHDFRSSLLNRIADAADDGGTPAELEAARRGHFDRLRYICQAAVADNGEDQEAEGILLVLDTLRPLILREKEARHD